MALETGLVGVEATDMLLLVGAGPVPCVLRAFQQQQEPIQAGHDANRADVARAAGGHGWFWG